MWAVSCARRVQQFRALVDEVGFVEGLREDIRDVVFGGDVFHADCRLVDKLSDLEVTCLDVLRALVRSVVVGKVDHALVVDEEVSGLVRGDAEVVHERA